jgi:Spy/CpxP family protein refolding chaperone
MRSKLGIALIGIVVFLLGGVAGAVSHYLYVKDQLKLAAVPKGPPKPGGIQEALAKKLDLDSQQRESLKVIFAKSKEQFTALNREYKPKWDAVRSPFDEEVMKIRTEFDGEVKKILRPDQRATFDEFLKQVYAQPPVRRPTQPAR